MTEIPPDHPRYLSLKERHDIIDGMHQKILAQAGISGSLEKWELTTKDGTKLDMNQSFTEAGIISSQKLVLSKGAGKGA